MSNQYPSNHEQLRLPTTELQPGEVAVKNILPPPSGARLG